MITTITKILSNKTMTTDNILGNDIFSGDFNISLVPELGKANNILD